jgi:AmmeMemoRadiSam system protein A
MNSRDGRALLDVARDAIREGLHSGRPWLPDPLEYADALRELRATFVTLRRDGDLRGCIGGLEAVRPLVIDVAHHAFAAAFNDPRFPPLEVPEFDALEVRVSILSPPEPVVFASEADLAAKLRPGVDGLILEDGLQRGTFLPAVWENLPQPSDFLRELKRKAGLAPDHWSDAIRVRRYTVESIP